MTEITMSHLPDVGSSVLVPDDAVAYFAKDGDAAFPERAVKAKVAQMLTSALGNYLADTTMKPGQPVLISLTMGEDRTTEPEGTLYSMVVSQDLVEFAHHDTSRRT